MTFELVHSTMSADADDKVVAKVILNFFLYQYQRALEGKINSSQELRAMKAANEAARAEYNKDTEMGGMGWNRQYPYDEANMKYKEEEVKREEQEFREMARVLEFVKDRFVEKFV